MVLIIGGAYQGKLDFARQLYDLTQEEIFTCTDCKIDFSKRCVNALEEFTYGCVVEGVDAVEYLKANRAKWQESILICQDITCGVVPLGSDMRAWRRETGRLCQYLSAEADHVSRIFCGLEQRLK